MNRGLFYFKIKLCIFGDVIIVPLDFSMWVRPVRKRFFKEEYLALNVKLYIYSSD